jgi:class 3 adenylate cyclase
VIRLRSRFTGRDALLREIEREFDDVLAGRPRVAIVSGEAGVGKSRIVRELGERLSRTATGVTARAEATGTPGLASVQRLVDVLVRQRSRSGRDFGYSAYAPERLDGPMLDVPSESDVLSTAIGNILDLIGDEPHLLIIEDLHWCEPVVIRFIEQFCAELADSSNFTPILLVMTCRRYPESATVEDLIRHLRPLIAPLEVNVRPLDEHETEELVRSYGVVEPMRDLIHHLAAANGNPFTINEAMHEYVRCGALAAVDGDSHGVLRVVQPLPTLRAATSTDRFIENRLGRLPRPSRRLIDVLSALGGSLPVDDYRTLVDLPDDICEAAMEEAVEDGLLAIDDGVVRFGHDLIADAASRLLGPGHGTTLRVEVLGRLMSINDPPAGVVGRLILNLPEVRPTESMMDALAAAGRQAAANAAWDDAIGLFRRYLDEAAILPASGEVLAARLGLARCLDRGLRFSEARVEYQTLASEAETAGDLDTWAAAAGELMSGVAVRGDRPDPTGVDGVLSVVADQRPDLQALLLTKQSIALATAGALERAVQLSDQATHIAAGLSNVALQLEILDTIGMSELALMQTAAARRRFETLLATARPVLDRTRPAWAHSRLALIAWMEGNFEEAEMYVSEAHAQFVRGRHRFGQSLAVSIQAGLAAARGDLDLAAERADRALWLDQVSRHHFAPMILLPAMTYASVLRGDSAATENFANRWAGSRIPGSHFALALAEHWSGATPSLSNEQRSRLRRSLVRKPDSVVTHADIGLALEIIGAVEVDGEFAEAAGIACDHIAGLHDRVLFSPLHPFSAARLVGSAFARAGSETEALRWLRRSLEMCAESSTIPELMRTHLALAGLEADVADSHASTAAELATQIGARFGAHSSTGEQVLGSAQQELVVMVTDLVGSTGVSVRDGDEAYVALVERHHRLVRAALLANGGTEFSTSGDGIYAWFSEPMAAVRCASDVQRSFRGDVTSPTASAVKVALVCGRPIVRRGHVYGAAVNLAARLVGLAKPGQIVVNELVKVRIRSDRSRLLGQYTLKGFDGPVAVYTLPIGEHSSRID